MYRQEQLLRLLASNLMQSGKQATMMFPMMLPTHDLHRSSGQILFPMLKLCAGILGHFHFHNGKDTRFALLPLLHQFLPFQTNKHLDLA